MSEVETAPVSRDLLREQRPLHILRHALGYSGHDGSGKAHRNYYAAPIGGETLDACNDLARAGLLKVQPGTGGFGFSVTEAGIAALDTYEKPKDARVAWVEAETKRRLSDFQRRAVVLLCQAMRCGPYDFARTFETADWEHGRGIRFRVRRPRLSTFDTDGLTALVLGAHEQAIRVQIDPATFTHLDITMHPRSREHASQWGRHPSIDQVLARHAPVTAEV